MANCTWDNYYFVVETIDSNLEGEGVFIFAGRNKFDTWTALFIGHIEDFQFIPLHPILIEAKNMGATHIHIFEVSNARKRELLTKRFISIYQPFLNQSEQPNNQPTPIKDINMSTDEQNAIQSLEETKSKLDLLYQYEKHYLELIKGYKEEIKFANSLQEDLRRERSQFFTQTLKDVTQTMKGAEIDKNVSAKWIEELVVSYTKSIDLSSDLAKTHVIQIVSILSEETKREVSKAKLDNFSTETKHEVPETKSDNIYKKPDAQ